MGKIKDTTNLGTDYLLVSQTPINFSKDNYYLKQLQDKVDAEWCYRSNVCLVEEEKTHGHHDYKPLEVVIQSIKDDKGQKVSDDFRRIVFKDIRYPSRLGDRFRFSYNFDLDEPNEDKSIWIVINRDTASPTSSVIINRCNGTLGTIEQDKDGKSYYHYEPVIVTKDLINTKQYYTQTIDTAQSDIVMIVQYNHITAQYVKNQRFFVGLDQVYRIKAISNNDSLATYKPDDISYLILYASLDEKGLDAKDDLEHRIAYFKDETLPSETKDIKKGNYVFKIIEPSPLPTELFSQQIIFKCMIFEDGQETNIPVNVTTFLPFTDKPEKYYIFEQGEEFNTFILWRIKVYSKALLEVKCQVPEEYECFEGELGQRFELSLRGLE